MMNYHLFTKRKAALETAAAEAAEWQTREKKGGLLCNK